MTPAALAPQRADERGLGGGVSDDHLGAHGARLVGGRREPDEVVPRAHRNGFGERRLVAVRRISERQHARARLRVPGARPGGLAECF